MQRQICRKEVFSVIHADASRRERGALNHANLAKDHQTAEDSINQGRKEAYRTCKQHQAEMRLRHQAGSKGHIDGHEPILLSHHERKKKKKKKRKKKNNKKYTRFSATSSLPLSTTSSVDVLPPKMYKPACSMSRALPLVVSIQVVFVTVSLVVTVTYSASEPAGTQSASKRSRWHRTKRHSLRHSSMQPGRSYIAVDSIQDMMAAWWMRNTGADPDRPILIMTTGMLVEIIIITITITITTTIIVMMIATMRMMMIMTMTMLAVIGTLTILIMIATMMMLMMERMIIIAIMMMAMIMTTVAITITLTTTELTLMLC